MKIKSVLLGISFATLICGCGQQKPDPRVDDLEKRVAVLQTQLDTLQSNVQFQSDTYSGLIMTNTMDSLDQVRRIEQLEITETIVTNQLETLSEAMQMTLSDLQAMRRTNNIRQQIQSVNNMCASRAI